MIQNNFHLGFTVRVIGVNEFEKFYCFLGLDETSLEEEQSMNNDYDTLDAFKEKLMSILTPSEMDLFLSGKPFKIYALFELYSNYYQAGKLMYYSSAMIKKHYDEYGVDVDGVNNDMIRIQKIYERG